MEEPQNLSGSAGESAASQGNASPRQTRAVLEVWTPQSESDKAAVKVQLDLLLAHPLFFQSKRYPALLRFVVEQTIEGNADQVKERSIGMEVFGRPPGYDANADPVVRVTAGEIRKRLAQYYYDPAHGDELRIELPTGSYVPVFQRYCESISPMAELPAPVSQEAAPALAAAATLPAGLATSLWASESVKSASRHNWPLYFVFALVPTALVLGLGIGRWYRHTDPVATVALDQAVDDFWQPMSAGPATVTFCLGEPARDSSGDDDPSKPIQRTRPTEPLYFKLRQSGLFALADVVTLTRMTAPLQKQHKAFRVSAASEAGFAQLREGPVVLIGAYDNLWTMRLTRDLRFGFDSVEGNARIIDRKSSNKTTWSTAWDTPSQNLARDFAILARYRDPMTGQPVVIAAGISEEGTEAAGELSTNATDLGTLLHDAPANWRNMNMEAVIETQVIDGHAGPPQVRAVTFW